MPIYNNIREKRVNFPEKFVLGDCMMCLVINVVSRSRTITLVQENFDIRVE